jgi:uncharacterized protein (TIGR03083 family)
VGHHGGVTAPADDELRQRCLAAVIEEGDRFAALAGELAAGRTPAVEGLDTVVPWVPAWTARELVGHLGTVHRWATAIVRAGHTDPPPPEARQAPPHTGLLDWYAGGLSDLVRVLRSTPPSTPAWHMSPAAEKVAASWVRRQAHELLIHRLDLEVAAGVAHAPVDPALAEDGVDELLSIVVPRWADTPPLTDADATVAVTATNTGRTWSVRVDHGRVTVQPRLSGREDAHLRGTSTCLLLRLWGRPADVTVGGDPAAEALLRGR